MDVQFSRLFEFANSLTNKSDDELVKWIRSYPKRITAAARGEMLTPVAYEQLRFDAVLCCLLSRKLGVWQDIESDWREVIADANIANQ